MLACLSFAAAMAIGITTTDPWLVRLERAAAESPREVASPELIAVIEDRRALVATAALMGLIVLLVFTMVVKPFD